MKREKSFLKKITLMFVLFLLIHVGHTFVTNDAVRLPEKLQGFGTIKQEEHPIASDKYGWELVLVNQDNYIADDYEMTLMELSNGQKIDSRIYPYLQGMFDPYLTKWFTSERLSSFIQFLKLFFNISATGGRDRLQRMSNC